MSVDEPLRDAMLRAAARAFARGLKGELLPPRGVDAPVGNAGVAAGEDVPARDPTGKDSDARLVDEGTPEALVGANPPELAPPWPPWGTVRVLPVAEFGGEPDAVGGLEKKASGGGWSGGGMSSPRAAAVSWYSVQVLEKS